MQRDKVKNLDSHCFERVSPIDECCFTVRCDIEDDAETIESGELIVLNNL